jgi:hypothetical protein
MEVGTIGPEGMVGFPIILAADEIGNRAFVQIVGHARRMSAERLLKLLPGCPQLHRLLLRYTLAMIHDSADRRLQSCPRGRATVC